MTRLVSATAPLLAAALLACTAAAPNPPAPLPGDSQAVKGCGDFLALAGKKPAGARFTGCSYAPERQGKPLRATYEVPGSDAAAVEAQLVRTVKLHPLRRACCQWDSPASQFHDAGGREYSVTMVSPETTVDRRADWAKIPRFEIAVETLTEEI